MIRRLTRRGQQPPVTLQPLSLSSPPSPLTIPPTHRHDLAVWAGGASQRILSPREPRPFVGRGRWCRMEGRGPPRWRPPVAMIDKMPGEVPRNPPSLPLPEYSLSSYSLSSSGPKSRSVSWYLISTPSNHHPPPIQYFDLHYFRPARTLPI